MEAVRKKIRTLKNKLKEAEEAAENAERELEETNAEADRAEERVG